MNSRRDSQFHEVAEVKCVCVRGVCVWCMWMRADVCFGLGGFLFRTGFLGTINPEKHS